MRHLSLAGSLLLLAVVPLTGCLASQYCCKYDVEDICANMANSWAYLEFELDKDEMLAGCITVGESLATVDFFCSQADLFHILEAVEDYETISFNQEYVFKITAVEPTRVRCYFRYHDFLGWVWADADFCCNKHPVDYWAKESGPLWAGPTMMEP